MRLNVLAAVALATAVGFTAIDASSPTEAQAQTQQKKKRTAKKAAKRYGPVPVSLERPRARITVVRRTFLDPGRQVIPGSQGEFTNYAFPPGYSPTSVIDHRNSGGRGALPGPFDLPGRDNPYPWNWCVGC